MSPAIVQWLHHMPNNFIWLTLVVVNLLLFLVLPVAIRVFMKIEINPDAVKGADDAFKTLVGLTMALIAFALVQVEGLHRNVGDLVSREGAILLKFDRTLDELTKDQAVFVKAPFRAYVSSLIRSEWPAMAQGRRSDETASTLTALNEGIAKMDASTPPPPGVLGEIKGQLIQLKDVREARLSSSHMTLSPYFWWGILLAMMSLAVLGWFQAPLQKAIPYLGGLVVGLSTLLTVLIVSSGIFEGESRVSPDAISRTLSLMDASRVTVGPSGH